MGKQELFRRIIALPLLVAASGCVSLPDLAPFADATAEVHRGVQSGHDAARAELELLASLHPDDPDYTGFVERLSAAWKTRLAATDALVAYADSLAAIAEAGNKGAEDARSLAGSVDKLLSAVGSTAVVPGTAVEIGAAAYGAIAKIRATKALKDALGIANPVVQDIGKILGKDLEKLADLMKREELQADVENAVKRSYETRLSASLSYRDALIARRKADQMSIAASVAAPAASTEATDLPIRRQRLLETEELLEATEAWYAPMVKDLDDVERRFTAQRSLVEKTRKAVSQWMETHHGLTTTVAEGSAQVNTRLLLDTAFEIRGILEKGGPR